MEIRTTANGKLRPYFNQWEMEAIHDFGFTPAFVDGFSWEHLDNQEAPVAELVSMVLHYDERGVIIRDNDKMKIQYPVYIPLDDEEDSPLVLDWCSPLHAPWPSNGAILVGQLVQIAYRNPEQRSAIKEKLSRLGEAFECINENREVGWPLPTLEKIGKIWWALIEAETPDFSCVLLTKEEYDARNEAESHVR